MKRLKVEKSGSEGIAMGTVYFWKNAEPRAEEYQITEGETDEEIKKFHRSVQVAVEQLKKLSGKSDVFDAHIQLACDPSLKERVEEKIQKRFLNVQKAVEEAFGEFAQILETMDDAYLRERAMDIRDVSSRILGILQGKEKEEQTLEDKGIVVARNLTPSDTAGMDYDKVLGFITEEGGVTSHVCIMARNKGIPALTGVKEITETTKPGDFLIMDGGSGEILVNPSKEVILRYQLKQREYEKEREALQKNAGLPAVTRDGHAVDIFANVGDGMELSMAKENKAEGIGLYRSEFLFLEDTEFPSEEKQFLAYREAVEAVEKGVTIRTLDVGGDKRLPYLPMEREENPFLGYRAIRISLTMKERFKEQLRAILRASAMGKVRILFPMVMSLDELFEAKDLVEVCKKELSEEGIPFDRDIMVGIMVETPAAVIMAEDLARNVDFFSIGTNDLTQYTLAVDRGNEQVAALFDPLNPAVLRSVAHVIRSGHQAGIPVGMCGEAAGDENLIELFLGMGLDEFSMTSRRIPRAKQRIRECRYEKAKDFARTVLEGRTVKEIKSQWPASVS